MPADFFIDVELGVVYSKASGRLDLAGGLDHVARLLRHPDFQPKFKQLFDFREVTEMSLSSRDIRELATPTVFSRHSLRAFVVSSDLQFALGRMFEAYRNLAGEREIAIFREMKEALAWLRLAAEAGPGRFPRLAPESGGAPHFKPEGLPQIHGEQFSHD